MDFAIFTLSAVQIITSTHHIIIPWKMSCLEGANFSGLVAISAISTKADKSNQVSFHSTIKLKMQTERRQGRNFLADVRGAIAKSRQ